MIKPDITIFYFEKNGYIPNNPTLPVLHYKQVFQNNEDKMEMIITSNNWKNTWINGIYDFHHYHSNAHEVLGILKGSGLLLIGGESGTKVIVNSGDILVLPAGTGHKKLSASIDFQVIGAYPDGQEFNLKQNTKEDIEGTGEEIKKALLPTKDPVYGEHGPLVKLWNKKMSNL
ncbi:cupin domain-containing protein [Niallia sp. NCCP-28]|uniref:cupin domain-containing protein n=1 Tax=Niallia sp. NCCP-28 TaxID=2934712 RepID=UPI00207E97BB|nr:cupin domain-containing protein [Niallia sp. NCCP-28]GKU83445.1 hypothetical protein NCCP28_28410 [Niallia sp. NCCP-28]